MTGSIQNGIKNVIKGTCVKLESTFFWGDIDERRRYTKKVHPLKALVGPSTVKRRIRGDLWAG